VQNAEKNHPGERECAKIFLCRAVCTQGSLPFFGVQGFPMDHPMTAIAAAPMISAIPLKELPARILRNPRKTSTAEQQYRISGATDWTKNIAHHPPSMISMMPPILCPVNKKGAPQVMRAWGGPFILRDLCVGKFINRTKLFFYVAIFSPVFPEMPIVLVIQSILFILFTAGRYGRNSI